MESYDPADQETVYFGGCSAQVCPDAYTWVFAHGHWTNVTDPSDEPPARHSASVDYDANMRGVLLFGGTGASGVLGDTWLFQGGRWTNLTFVDQGPSPREGAAMAFDPAPEENGSVLFGGCVPAFLSQVCTNDTWVWQSWAGWVPLPTSIAPPSVGFAQVAYDPVSGDIVLFGGCSGSFCFGISGQTWLLYSGQWWAAYPSTSPAARTGGAMVFDPAIGGVLLFGGIDSSLAYENDTWSFSDGNWQPWGPPVTPTPRADFGLTTDPSGATPLLVGGSSSSGSQNDTWAFEYLPGALLLPHPASAEVSEPVTFTLSLSDGTSPYNATIGFGDGTSRLVSGPGPTITVNHTFTRPGSYAAWANVTDGVGATFTATADPVSVGAGPAIGVSALSPGADVGIPASFRASVVAPGAPPLHVAWQFSDGGNATGANVTRSFARAGAYQVEAVATDADGGSASASLTFPVAPVPTVSIQNGPSAPGTSAIGFEASVVGGTPPFSYSWSFGDGGTSGLPEPVHQYAGTGSFTVTLWVNDSGGGSAHQTTSISAVGPVAPPGSGSGSASGVPLWFWAGLIVLVVIGAVGTAFLMRRARAPPTGSPP
jgi:hypothetical protein